MTLGLYRSFIMMAIRKYKNVHKIHLIQLQDAQIEYNP